MSSFDSGGAGSATYMILKGLRSCGYEVKMLVKNKTVYDSDVIEYNYNKKPVSLAARLHNKIRNRISPPKPIRTDPAYYFFNPDEKENYIRPEDIAGQIIIKPKLIIGAWISGFVNLKTISDLATYFSAKPYVSTMDMSPLTGGCHYAFDCLGYTKECKACPAILDASQKDIAHQNLLLKKDAVAKGNIQCLAGSSWTARQVKRSALFSRQKDIPVFPGLIDTEIYNSVNRNIAKKVFNISSDHKVIIAGAIDMKEKRKGFAELIQTLNILHKILYPEQAKNIIVMMAGKLPTEYASIPFQLKQIEYIKDERLLSLFYQAADIFVCPSIEDAGPQMTLQAMACGTLVVSFCVGFGADIVQNGYNGFAVPAGNSRALAEGIAEVLNADISIFDKMSLNAGDTIKELASLRALDTFFGGL